jgi:hypothetical protein
VGVNPPGALRVVTDANGYYIFRGLKPGNYTVIEAQPKELLDSVDTPGTQGGLTLNPSDIETVEPQAVLPFADAGLDLRSDAILRIGLAAGQHAQENNFSEVRVQPVVPPPPKEPKEPLLPPPRVNLPPFIPLTPLELVPTTVTEELISGRGSFGVTWHLSLIDGGSPRLAESTRINGVPWRAASARDQSAWNEKYLNAGVWFIPTEQGVKKFRFGLPGSIPVTGDFNGDGHDDLGVYYRGEWFLDLNGNGVWDAGDLWAKLGTEKDRPVVGDWDGDGKDDIGIFGPQWRHDFRQIDAEPGLPDVANTLPRGPRNVPPSAVEATVGERLLQATAAGPERADLIDHVFQFGTITDVPVAGDWNGDGVGAIGLFRGGKWHFDNDGDGRWSPGDQRAQFGREGDLPVVGDWDGDGVDQIGVYRRGEWILDTNGNRQLDDADQRLTLGEPGQVPIAGDWNGDGVDEPAMVDTTAVPPAAEGGEASGE